MTTPLVTLLSVTVLAADQAPAPEDVKAGWLGFAVWLGLVVAVALLAISFVRQLRKVNFEEKPDEPGEAPGETREGPATRS